MSTTSTIETTNGRLDASRWVIPLRRVARGDARRVGAKAQHLAELAQAGFEVPDGFVVTTDVLDHVLSEVAAGADAQAARAAIARAPLPPQVETAIRAAALALGDAPLAVRSSGVAEDGKAASFAGQYETVLGARGGEEVMSAIQRCWASAFSARVERYGAARDQRDLTRLAVLVQTLLDPTAAGVAFTANPLTGARDEVVINAVKGLGERLVSGRASPDMWIVREGRAACERDEEHSLTADTASQVATLARRVEAHFGCPQDIEWALVHDRLSLLQARPITALPKATKPVPVDATPPPGFWTRNAAYFPEPLSPMVRSFFIDALNGAYRRFFTEVGALAEGMESREIGGWMYMRVVPLGGRNLPPPPRWMFPILFRIVPMLRRRIRASVEAIRTDRFGGYIERYATEFRPELAATIARYQAMDRSQLTDDALIAHVRETARFVRGAVETHFLIIGAHFFALAELAFACRDLLGWDEKKVVALMSGLSDKSTEPSQRLADLARRARESPRLAALLVEGASPEAALSALDTDAAFAEAFHAYQREFGCRALRYEVAEPTLAETPALILRLIRDQIARGYDGDASHHALSGQRAEVLAEAEAALAGRSAGDRARFSRALARAQRAYPIREDNEFYTLSAPLAVMRYAVLELGRRLADKGVIDARDDVFFLELDEALHALRGGGRRQTLVERRQGERAWVKAHPGPMSHGKDPGLPAVVDGLPPEAQFVFNAGVWMRDQGFAPAESERKQAGGAAIDGIPASAGTYTGPARVVHDESEFDKIRPGDVLICPITSPVWSVLFPSIGALVTDTGGLLSHSAIIAREYRVPAVLATGNATALLRDGQVVTVDGTRGLVRIGS